MTPIEAKQIRDRLAIFERLSSNINWMNDLIAAAKDDETTLSVWDKRDSSRTLNINKEERGNILRDLKDAMICVLERRVRESREQQERT